MEFNKIIAVTGKPGLFHVVSQTKTGIVVESLSDKKRFAILSTQNVSLLENIAIFTYEEEVPLLTVFKSIFEKEEGKETISHKESGAKLACGRPCGAKQSGIWARVCLRRPCGAKQWAQKRALSVHWTV